MINNANLHIKNKRLIDVRIRYTHTKKNYYDFNPSQIKKKEKNAKHSNILQSKTKDSSKSTRPIKGDSRAGMIHSLHPCSNIGGCIDRTTRDTVIFICSKRHIEKKAQQIYIIPFLANDATTMPCWTSLNTRCTLLVSVAHVTCV